ncbi:hypothetical protein ACFL01_00095 [Planctomycetota bacterium]
MRMSALFVCVSMLFGLAAVAPAEEFPKPYSAPCTERENVFAFTAKPKVEMVGKDKYEITFAVKGSCDVTAGLVDKKGTVVRHLGSGVLGTNAPEPFQKSSLAQKIIWDGKDDLGRYVKDPKALRVSIQLGLKPVFDRLLGPSNPKNLPGKVLGFAVDKEGVYVFSKGRNIYVRKFDRDANYAKTLVPPPSDLPESKLGGRTYVEYEKGKKSHHGAFIMQDMGFNGNSVPGLDDSYINTFQTVSSKGRLFFCNGGGSYHHKQASTLYYFYNDGSTDVKGSKGRQFITWRGRHQDQRFAVSPDDKWVYMVGMSGNNNNSPVVMRFSADGDEPAKPFIGKTGGKPNAPVFPPGSDNEHFNNPTGIDTDSKGRIYVADRHNNRVQVFSSDGKYLKTIKVPGVSTVQVHKKTGAIYVLHSGNVKGRSVGRLSKHTSFDSPTQEFGMDHVNAKTFVLDSWAPKPRLWVNGYVRAVSQYERPAEANNVTVWEEKGKSFKLISDFDAEAKKSAGTDYTGRWSGGVFDHVNADPTREQVYYQAFRSNPWKFDLKTGKLLGRVQMRGPINDIAFDKRGYMHIHFDPGFHMPGVGRMDPDQSAPYKDHLGRLHKGHTVYAEVPYDYGVELSKPQTWGWIGGIPVKDQPGAKYFQDGFGVNMRGDIAVQTNIYYIPKMEEEGFASAYVGPKVRVARGGTWFTDSDPYTAYMKRIQEKLRKGEEIYFIKRRPGIPLSGGTVWTYDATGELREECAVIAHKLVVGLHMDEDGFLYFSNSRARIFDGKPFLGNKGGNLGTEEPIVSYNRNPVTYTLMKTKPKKVRWIMKDAKVPMDPLPNRPTDLVSYGPFGSPQMGGGEVWADGVLWMYAGLSPGVPAGCTCPATRFQLDWYKRSFLPEAYRRSLGVVDTNGNLIMHFGRYGTLDDALAMKQGSEDIAVHLPRFVSATDNYVCFDDWGERLVSCKLTYHAEELADVK